MSSTTKRLVTAAVGLVTAAAVGLGIVSGPSDSIIEGEEHAPGGDEVQAVPFPGEVVETGTTQHIVWRFQGQDYNNFPEVRLRSLLPPVEDQIRRKGDPWSNDMTRPVALQRLEDKATRAPLEIVWQIRGGGSTFNIHRYDENPSAFLATAGNEAIDILVGTVVQHYPSVRSYGIFVCKKISGSSAWSQHAFFNAVDFGGPGPWGSQGNIDLLDDIDADVKRWTAQGYLDVSQFGWRNWDNHYPGHSHYSGAPLRTGTPECAR